MELNRWSLIDPSSIPASTECIRFAVNTLLVLAAVFLVERKDARSIGILRFRASDLWIGIGCWLLYTLLISTRLYIHKFLSLNTFAEGPFYGYSESAYLLIVAADVIFEEIGTRAYIIERATLATGSKLTAGALSILVSVIIHLPTLSLREALLRIPGLLILTIEYILCRSTTACIISHFLFDTYFRVIAVSAPILIEWVMFPERVCLLIATEIALFFATRSLHRTFTRNR